MWFSPPLTLLMNPTCLLWLKKTKIPRPLDWDRPRIIPLPAPPPSRPHTTTPDPNNCEQSTKLPVKTRKLTATTFRFLSHIWRNCRFVKLYTRLQVFVKFGFSEKATKFEKIFVVLLTRALCSVRATAYLSKSWQRFFKTNMVKLYYTNFTDTTIFGGKKSHEE